MLRLPTDHRLLAACLLLTHGVLAGVMFWQGSLPADRQLSGPVTVVLSGFVVVGLSLVNMFAHIVVSAGEMMRQNQIQESGVRRVQQAIIDDLMSTRDALVDELARVNALNRLQTTEITGFDLPPVQRMNRIIILEDCDVGRTGRPDEGVRTDDKCVSDSVAPDVCET